MTLPLSFSAGLSWRKLVTGMRKSPPAVPARAKEPASQKNRKASGRCMVAPASSSPAAIARLEGTRWPDHRDITTRRAAI